MSKSEKTEGYAACGCSLYYVEEGLHCPHDMAKLLCSKLTKEELDQLMDLIDGDPPAGPFWEAMNEKNFELNPEKYCDSKEYKEEVTD